MIVSGFPSNVSQINISYINIIRQNGATVFVFICHPLQILYKFDFRFFISIEERLAAKHIKKGDIVVRENHKHLMFSKSKAPIKIICQTNLRLVLINQGYSNLNDFIFS